MKNWISKNYKTLIIAAFLIPILTVAVVSISHVTEWYGISNPVTWAIYLSVGIEIAALSALAAISANMGSKVYFPFAIVTVVQFIGNIFFAYSYIDIDSKQFKDWVDLVAPLVEFMGVDPNDYVGHKRFLALFSGGMLPLISLSFLHMLVKFTEEDRKNGEKIVIDEQKHLVDDKIIEEAIEKYKKEHSNPEDLKEFVDESTRIRLSDEDLRILEETLLNPPAPNDKLKEAAEKYKETQREMLTQIMKNDQELGLYDEPITNPIIDEEIVEEVEEPIETERTQLQKLEDYVKPSTTPENIPDTETSIWDDTLMDGIEEENIFQEEPTIEEEVQNFSTIEDNSANIFQEEVKPEFEIPEQEGWTEEMEQQYWEEQVPEPFATPEEVEKFKIDFQTIEEPQPIQTIETPQPIQTITIDEEKFKPFEVDLTVEEPAIEPTPEVTVEKKNL
jgi:hypothetical protein